jgi:hypothetical protein
MTIPLPGRNYLPRVSPQIADAIGGINIFLSRIPAS